MRHQDNEVELVVFDLDGTLLNSNHAMKTAFDRAYRLVVPGTVDVPFHELLERQGMPFPDIVQDMGWPTSLPRIFKAESMKMASEVSLFTGVRRVLEFLLGSAVKLAVLTGKDRCRTLALLEQFCLDALFTEVICGDDAFPGKPSADGINYIIAVTNSRRRRCQLIGDSHNDLLTARNAGVGFIGIQWPGQPNYLTSSDSCPLFFNGQDIISHFGGMKLCGTSS